jgi:hypothetical protein
MHPPMGPHLGFSSLLALLNPLFEPSRLMGSIRLAQLTKRNSSVPDIPPFRRLFRSLTRPQELLLFLACCQNRLWTCDRLAKRGWPASLLVMSQVCTGNCETLFVPVPLL